MSSSTGRLYLVPNTLDFGVQGASSDICDVLPLGALKIAARLAYWVSENAKTTRALLKRVHEIVPLSQPLQSIQIVDLPRPAKGRSATEPPDMAALLQPALQGHDIGLSSEAGLPAVADPGATLVAAAHQLGIAVVPLSGPSSLMMALAASGLNGQSFAFVGYLPVDAAQRVARIRELEAWSRRAGQSQLLIETPYRNPALLDALLNTLQPNTRLSVSMGLTLPGGWTRCDTVAQWRRTTPQVPADVPAVFAFQAS